MDWDDVRIFLAVARKGSVRAAATQLHVNHATVLRRIAKLEQDLGAQMFERLPAGYRLTSAGEEVLDLAEQMDASSLQLQTRVFARDLSARGKLRVTLPPFFATHLLMPDLAAFAHQHPEIELELIPSGAVANLTNREADVALRLIADRKNLPLNLHALKGPELRSCVYLASERLAEWREKKVEKLRWIGIDSASTPDWVSDVGAAFQDVPFRTPDPEAQVAAVRQGVGVTALPCFVGDPDPLLARWPGARLTPPSTLWLLTQGETRKTKRVRLFVEFIAKRLARQSALLGGLEG